jgi:hypothetical protein
MRLRKGSPPRPFGLLVKGPDVAGDEGVIHISKGGEKVAPLAGESHIIFNKPILTIFGMRQVERKNQQVATSNKASSRFHGIGKRGQFLNIEGMYPGMMRREYSGVNLTVINKQPDIAVSGLH